MKKRKRIAFRTVIALLLALAGIASPMVCGATSLGTIRDMEGIDASLLLDFDRPVISPDGKYVIECVRPNAEELRVAQFIVYSNDEAREMIHEAKRATLLSFSNFIFWEPDPDVCRIWVYDGDTGTYFIEEIDGEWKYYSSPYGRTGWYPYRDLNDEQAGTQYPGKVEIPELLKKLRPRQFDK